MACAPEPSESWEGCDVRLLPVAREALAAQPFGGLPPHPSVDGAAAYGADMELAGALLRALASHTALPGWCPVASTNASGRCLYAQAVPRFVDPAGQLVSGEAAVRAAERIGLARHVDRHMVALVLDALAADPLTTLGVEISAQSARQDSWWHDIGRRLDRDAGLARRLVIEISGASPLGVEHEVLAFVQAMRARGCRIALRNLGSGHASVRTLMALAPDIVKIDAFFLQAAIPSGKARALFGRIAGLAAALGGVIVAEGADSPELVAIAREDGIAWVQGGSAGGTVSMPGRAAPPVVFGDALIAAGYADFAASHAPAVNSVAPDRHGNRQARPLVRVAKQGGRA